MTGQLIGIGGYAGSGKDAVADILEDSHGFYGTFMSQPLNAALCRLNPQVEVRPGEVPVFWACGVTMERAITAAGLPFAITHAPGHMLITDARDSDYQVP